MVLNRPHEFRVNSLGRVALGITKGVRRTRRGAFVQFGSDSGPIPSP